MIFSKENTDSIDFSIEASGHFYFLHHYHVRSSVTFTGEKKEIFLSIKASLARNMNVYLFGKMFNWNEFLSEKAKANINHQFYARDTLLLLPSLKNRLSKGEVESNFSLEDLLKFSNSLK